MQWSWGGFPKVALVLCSVSCAKINYTKGNYSVSLVQVCQTERTGPELSRSSLSQPIPFDYSHFRTIQRQTSFDMDPPDSLETITVVRPEPRVFVAEPCPSDNLFSHSTPNNTSESSRSTHQALLIILPQVQTLQPVDSSDQLPVSSLDGQDTHNALTDCTANLVSTCSTHDARMANPGNSANTTSHANAASLIRNAYTISPNMSTNTVVSDYPDSQVNHADSVSLAATPRSGSKVITCTSEKLGISVSTISAFSETAHQSTAERVAVMERDSGIEPFTEGLAEDDKEMGTEDHSTKRDAESTEELRPVESVIQLEEQPSLSQPPSKALESQEKKKSRSPTVPSYLEELIIAVLHFMDLISIVLLFLKWAQFSSLCFTL